MIRLRSYKNCDAKIITTWLKDKATYINWSGERFGDFPVTAESINSKYQNHNGGCSESDNFYPMTALDNNEIVGHLIMRYINEDKSILRFGWVIVDSNKRGKGYGKRILALSLKYAFEIFMAKKMTIGVYEDNLPAYCCYKAVGFHETVSADYEYDEINGQKRKIIELEITRDKYYETHKKYFVDKTLA